MRRSVATLVSLALVTLVTGAAIAAPPPEEVTFTARLVDAGGPLDGAHDFDFALFDDPAAGSMVWGESHGALNVQNGLVDVSLGKASALAGVFSGAKLYLEVSVDGSVLAGRIPVVSVPYALRAALAAVAETANALAPSLVAQLDAAYLKKGATLACAGTGKVTGLDPFTGNVLCGADAVGPSYTPADTTITFTGTALAVNPVQIQRRVTGACAGSAIASVAQDGTVTCSGTILGFLNGGGLAVVGNLLMIPNDAINGGMIANNSVDSGAIADNSVGSGEIQPDSITAADINTSAVGSAEIADGTIAGIDVGPDALGPDDIALPMASASSAAGLVLTGSVTSNRLFPVAYTPTTNQQCLITVTSNLTNAGASASGQAGLRVVVRNNTAGLTTQDTTSATIAGAYSPSDGRAHASKSFVAAVTQASSYDFGCQFSASSDYVGDSMDCTVTYICQ